MKEIGIYVHIPFCKQKCLYCDFISYDDKKEKRMDYTKALMKELIARSKEAKQKEVSTIYFGGGTPSYLEAKQIKEILQTITSNYPVTEEAEITIEVNPGTVDLQKIQLYQQMGINRMSIGLQSTEDKVLQQIGRIHCYDQFLQTYFLAREAGFTNINVDLMLALPEQTLEILQESVKKVVALQPEHISIYSLILEEGTPFSELAKKGKLELPTEEIEREMYWKVKEELEKQGYLQYEISNFSKPKKESKHNINCWKQQEYLGFGVAAHSYLEMQRYSNIESLEEYLQNMQKQECNKNRILQEKQNRKEQEKEYMLLGLRTINGVCISEFKAKFVENPIYLFREELDKLIKQNLLKVERDTICLTKKGLDFANLVWEEFV